MPDPTGNPAHLAPLYDELDRLEELLEDMTELGVQTRDEAEARIVTLNRRIDLLEAAGEAGGSF